MRIHQFILAAAVFCTPVKAQEFISGFEDIPLASGLIQTSGNDFTFGNEETQYTETILIAQNKNTSFDYVSQFYKDSLTQLGWKLLKSTPKSVSFHREQDTLEITETRPNPLKISIVLKKQN